MSIRIILCLALVCGCSGNVEEAPARPASCPAVACSFVQGGCDPETNTYTEHTVYDDGKGCWSMTAACYPKNTPAGCEPADCYEETSLACH